MSNSREETFLTLTDSDATSDMATIPPKMRTIITIPDGPPVKPRNTITIKCILGYTICLVLLCAAYAGAYINFSMHLFTLELEHAAKIDSLQDQRDVMWRQFITERTKLKRLAEHIENFDVIFDQVRN